MCDKYLLINSETEIASGHGCTRFVKHSNMDALTKNGKSILAKDGALRVTVYMLQLRREDPSLESIIASTSSNVTDNDSTKELEFAALAATSIVRGPARIVLSDLLAAVEADRSGRAASAACDDNLRKATVEWQNYARRLACVHGTALRRFLTAKLDRQIDCKTFPALHQHITQIVANALEIAQTEFSKCLDMLCLADKNAMRSELVNSSTISPLAKMAVQHVLQPRLRAALDGTDKPPTPKFSPAASDPMPVDDPLNAVIDSVCDAVVLWEEAYARFLTYVENMCTTGFFEPLISNIHDGLGRMLCKCEYSENELKMLTSIASSVATTSDEGTLNDEPAMPPPSKGIVQQLRRLAEGVGEASLSSLEKKMQDCKAQLAQFRKEQAENRTPSSAAEKHLNDLEANALRAFDEVQGQVQSLRTAMDYAAVNCATLDHQCIPTVDTKRENFKRGSAACKSLRDSCEAGTVTKSSIVDDGGTKTIVTDGTLVAVDERRCGNAHQIPTDVMLPTSVEPLPTASALPQVIVSTATLAPPPIAETTMSNLESNIMEMCFADMRGALQASAESELSGVRRMLNRGKI